MGIFKSIEVMLPFVEVIDAQREMIATVMGEDFLLPLTDDMQFLDRAQTEPGARECKSRAGQGIEPKNVPVKLTARFDILDVDRHMIQLQRFHNKNKISA